MEARSGSRDERLSAAAPHRTNAPHARNHVWTLVLAGCVALAVIITNLVDFAADDLRVGLLNASLGSSWSHRATAATLAAGALVTGTIATRSVPGRLWWSMTAAVFVLLLIIEISPVHAQLDSISYGKLTYAPVLVGLVVCVWRLEARSDQAPLMRAGLAGLLLSYGVHVFGSPVLEAVGWGRGSWIYQVKVGVKGGLELAGWLLVVMALWRSGTPLLRTDPVIRNMVLTNRLGPASKLVRWAVRGRTDPG